MIVSELRNEPASVLSPGVLMAGSSMVFSQDLEAGYLATPFDPRLDYAQEEISRILVRTTEDDQISFRFGEEPDVVGHLSRDAVPINLLHPANYFHFLIESLPTLLFLLRNNLLGNQTMLVSGLLHPNMWAALHYVTQRTPIPVLQLRTRQAVSCERAILAPPSWRATELIAGGVSDSVFNAANIQLLREAFKPLWSGAATSPKLKVFIRRTAGQRMVTNADEVERLATAAGYRVVDAGALDFLEQVQIFSAASHVLGPTGAWAANLAFVNPDAKVSIFYPQACAADRNIWRGLGEACGVEVTEIYCPISRYRERQPIHSDFIIPPEALRSCFA